MSEPRVFALTEDFDLDTLLNKIRETYGVEYIGSLQDEKLYLDTWEWSLFHNGMTMTRQGIQYTLQNQEGSLLVCNSGSRKKYPLWSDFNDDEFRKILSSITGIRALIPLFTVSSNTVTFAVRNNDEKVVLRLRMVENSVSRMEDENRMLDKVLFVEPLRGYKKPFTYVCKHIAELGVEQFHGDYNFMAQVHKVLEVDPNISDAKFSAHLAQDETVGQAISDICMILNSAMLRNLPGTLEDIDSEFLHDFRVSVRRTRSLLSLMKKYLPAEELAHFQAEFKWLGTVTGPVRDLDVYLLKKDDFRAMLPEELYPGLDWFLQALERQRKRQLQKLRESLKSERFQQLLDGWKQFLLDLPTREDYPKGQLVCRGVAEKILKKRFKRLLHNGCAITEETPDESLHQLRIEGKKFRYLLEFYRSLFYEDAVDAYLKQMKKLQNNLGDFNDFSVQKEVLVQRLGNMKPGAVHAVEIAAALGGLVVHLGDGQNQVRRKFERTFQEFATEENIRLLDAIFNQTPNSSEPGGCE